MGGREEKIILQAHWLLGNPVGSSKSSVLQQHITMINSNQHCPSILGMHQHMHINKVTNRTGSEEVDMISLLTNWDVKR
jgi:hypothetical protein